ncbi:hypothetical protein V3390_04285 [Luteimonas sp. FXH3W]|uniref:Tetratricopeptide repeat protein n=1 Tax=Aquilutibacter rugosus TaxID=3115820 RepID=A0ABU7V056_9GAMM
MIGDSNNKSLTTRLKVVDQSTAAIRTSQFFGVVLLSAPVIAGAKAVDVQSWYGQIPSAKPRGQVAERSTRLRSADAKQQWVADNVRQYRLQYAQADSRARSRVVPVVQSMYGGVGGADATMSISSPLIRSKKSRATTAATPAASATPTKVAPAAPVTQPAKVAVSKPTVASVARPRAIVTSKQTKAVTTQRAKPNVAKAVTALSPKSAARRVVRKETAAAAPAVTARRAIAAPTVASVAVVDAPVKATRVEPAVAASIPTPAPASAVPSIMDVPATVSAVPSIMDVPATPSATPAAMPSIMDVPATVGAVPSIMDVPATPSATPAAMPSIMDVPATPSAAPAAMPSIMDVPATVGAVPSIMEVPATVGPVPSIMDVPATVGAVPSIMEVPATVGPVPSIMDVPATVGAVPSIMDVPTTPSAFPAPTAGSTHSALTGSEGVQVSERSEGNSPEPEVYKVTAEAAPIRIATEAPKPMQMGAFEYVPQHEDPYSTIKRTRPQQAVVNANLAGDYRKVAKLGLPLVKSADADPEFRLIVGNALAWTGNTEAADAIYKTLLDTPMRLAALTAMANVMRWRGKDYRALPMYREVLATDSENNDALEGMALAKESLRPRTRVTLDTSGDVDNVETRALTVNYRWNTKDGARVWELEGRGVRAELPGGPQASQMQLTGRLHAHDLPMDPLIEVTASDRIYGLVTVSPIPDKPLRVHAGVVNWGDQSLNPRALDKRLTAWNVGATGQFPSVVGQFSFGFDQYRVSDGNNVSAGTLRLAPPFHVISKHIKPVIGMEFREARTNVAEYWSPADGYGTAFVGLDYEWSNDRWSLSASVQRGTRLWGEADKSWGASFNASYKLNADWSTGMRAWAISNTRDAKPYRAHTGMLFLERRW